MRIVRDEFSDLAVLETKEGLAKFRKPLALRARLISPASGPQPIMSRDREGAVLVSDSAEFLQVPLHLVLDASD